jgi:hypothetical protein
LREECLNQQVFVSLDDARRKLEQWRVAYHRERPHSRLGDLTPHEFAARAPQPIRSAADARTAWPVKRRLAGAVQSAPTAPSKPDIFSGHPMHCEGWPEKLLADAEKQEVKN